MVTARQYSIYGSASPEIQQDYETHAETFIFASEGISTDNEDPHQLPPLLQLVPHSVRAVELIVANLSAWGIPSDTYMNVQFGDVLVTGNYRGTGLYFALPTCTADAKQFVRADMEYGYALPVEMYALWVEHGLAYWQEVPGVRQCIRYVCIPEQHIDNCRNKYERDAEDFWEELSDDDNNNESEVAPWERPGPMQYALSLRYDTPRLVRGHGVWLDRDPFEGD